MKFIVFIAALLQISQFAISLSLKPFRRSSYETKQSNQDFACKTLAGALATLTIMAYPSLSYGAEEKYGIVQSDICEVGVGNGCEKASEGNELIIRLQKQSAERKDERMKEMLDTYNQHNFSDYFKTLNQHMVRRGPNQYEILTNSEYDAAKKLHLVENDRFIK